MTDAPPPRYRSTNENHVEGITPLPENIRNVTALDLHREEQYSMLRKVVKELKEQKHGFRKLDASAKLAQEVAAWKQLHEQTCRQHQEACRQHQEACRQHQEAWRQHQQAHRLNIADLTVRILLAEVVTVFALFVLGVIQRAYRGDYVSCIAASLLAVVVTVLVLFFTGVIQKAHSLDFVDLGLAIVFAIFANVGVMVLCVSITDASMD